MGTSDQVESTDFPPQAEVTPVRDYHERVRNSKGDSTKEDTEVQVPTPLPYSCYIVAYQRAES